jgi:hypothetical protein
VADRIKVLGENRVCTSIIVAAESWFRGLRDLLRCDGLIISLAAR